MTPRHIKARRAFALTLLVSLIALPLTKVNAGYLDPCQSTATAVGFPAAIAVCPAGDGQTLADVGARFDLAARDPSGVGVGYVYGGDWWLIGCSDTQTTYLCYGSYSSEADGYTDSSGETTMTGTIAAGGMGTGVHVVLQGEVLLAHPDCTEWRRFDLSFRSVDMDANLVVDAADLALFAASFPPNSYNPAADFNFDDAVDLGDLAVFAAHFGHECQW